MAAGNPIALVGGVVRVKSCRIFLHFYGILTTDKGIIANFKNAVYSIYEK